MYVHENPQRLSMRVLFLPFALHALLDACLLECKALRIKRQR